MPNLTHNPSWGRSPARSKTDRWIGAALLIATMGVCTAGHAGLLESPEENATKSGIGLIRGWVCDANEVTVSIDGGAAKVAAYGNIRADTLEACGDTNNGFALLWNWNLIGDGSHTVTAYADGVSIGSATFNVVTLGMSSNYVTGLPGSYLVADFPEAGRTTEIAWSESDQNFILRSVTPATTSTGTATSGRYPVVDTGQTRCFNASGSEMGCSGTGQDGAYSSITMSYVDNGDETVTDQVTGLMWQQSTDRTGDGQINADDKMTQSEATSYCANLTLAGHSDWRLPDIKTAYSLMSFAGSDGGGVPFIDTSVFGFGYGDTSAGERDIDAQYATTTLYVSPSARDGVVMFGVNLADGRIKSYPMSTFQGSSSFYVQCVRGDEQYGKNSFTDNGDETITDSATGLMWQKSDSGNITLNWQAAINYCEGSTFAGYSDWKLPDAKELQSIVDYTRAPDVTQSAAISPLFNATPFTNEAGTTDWGYYWSSSTHEQRFGGGWAAYVTFGRGLGYMNGQWVDIHGAGSQRSDPKDITLFDTTAATLVGDVITLGPQGDVLRGKNFARCVRRL